MQSFDELNYGRSDPVAIDLQPRQIYVQEKHIWADPGDLVEQVNNIACLTNHLYGFFLLHQKPEGSLYFRVRVRD